ncbi:MAG: FAD-dependent oxidoreductase [Pseudolabrys sp.]
MHIAVLGGGLQGCCIALVLARRGATVDLFDCNPSLLSRAAVANEGKIHLGYMYAGDPSLLTAGMMMRGALIFAPFFARHLDMPVDDIARSDPAVYLVHRESQRPVEQVADYFSQVHVMVREAADGRNGAYFGAEFQSGLRRWSDDERRAEFGPAVLAAFDTPEIAIDPVDLARRLRDRIAADPRIRLHLRHTVRSVEDDAGRLAVVSESSTGGCRERYDQVVNALWDGQFAIDERRGHRPGRPWLHRLKYGVSFRRPAALRPKSVTVVLGPFGEVVTFRSGMTYLTWYPACMQGFSGDVTPPPWRVYPEEPEEPRRSRLIEDTLAALTELVPALRGLDRADMSEVSVKGGVIVAWGATDIDDPKSELHRRFEIGVTSAGRYHTVNPGKLTMAPYFAESCADRIVCVPG